MSSPWWDRLTVPQEAGYWSKVTAMGQPCYSEADLLLQTHFSTQVGSPLALCLEWV